jgi:hypothetical protein
LIKLVGCANRLSGLMPIVIPHTAAGVALLIVFGRQAPLGRTLGLAGLRFTDHLPGIVVAMLFVSLPFLINTAREAFALVDPDLELVAETEGATRWQVFVYVTLPLAWRGILAGAIMMWGRGHQRIWRGGHSGLSPQNYAGAGLRAICGVWPGRGQTGGGPAYTGLFYGICAVTISDQVSV